MVTLHGIEHLEYLKTVNVCCQNKMGYDVAKNNPRRKGMKVKDLSR